MAWLMWVVNLVGLALLALIPWWFWLHRPAATQASREADAQVATITVRGGYHPDRISLQQHVPAMLLFERHEDDHTSEIMLIPELGIRRPLTAHDSTSVTIMPHHAGEFTFHNESNTIRGTITVVPTDEER